MRRQLAAALGDAVHARRLHSSNRNTQLVADPQLGALRGSEPAWGVVRRPPPLAPGVPEAIRTAPPSSALHVSVHLGQGQSLVITTNSAQHHRRSTSPWLLGFLCGGATTGIVAAACNLVPPPPPLPGRTHNHQAGSVASSLLAHEDGGTALAWLQGALRHQWPFSLGRAKAAGLDPGQRAAAATYPGGQLGAADQQRLPVPWLEGLDGAAAATSSSISGSSRSRSSCSSSSPGGAGALWSSSSQAASDTAARAAGDGVLLRSSIAQAAARAAPAVVHLEVTTSGGGAASGGGGQGAAAADGLSAGGLFSSSSRPVGGSGFIYDAGGWVLTNAHVVAAAAEGGAPLAVHLQDGRVYEGAVVALDRLSDLAVVRVQPEAPLPTVALASSRSLRLGDMCIALGSPLLLRHSVTAGIVSCTERSGSELGLAGSRHGFIQTDAAVNTGNSGGPLINLDGAVIGINNRKVVAADGVSFAIPIDCAKDVLQDISRHGRVLRPWIGVTMAEIKSSRMRQLQARRPGFPSHIASGIVVEAVQAGGPAALAGLQEDDVLVGVSGGCISSFVEQLKASIGRPVQVEVVRQRADGQGYESRRLSLTPAEATPA